MAGLLHVSIPFGVLLTSVASAFAPQQSNVKFASRILVPPSGRHLPFFAEQDGHVQECIDMRTDRTLKLHPSDHAVCRLASDHWGPWRFPHIAEICVAERHEQPLPGVRTLSGEEFYNLPKTNAFVAIQGIVHDVCRDDIDENFGFVFIDCRGKIIEAYFGIADGGFDEMASLVGAEIVLTGVTYGAPRTSGTPQPDTGRNDR